MHSSSRSSECRLDWRPSRALAVAMIVLGLLAALSLALCALPLLAKLPASLAAAGQGLWLARRELRRPACTLHWPGGDTPATISLPGTRAVPTDPGQTWTHLRLHMRTGIAVLGGRDPSGRMHRLAWWPDTLPSSSRRQLRLAAAVSCRSDKPPPQLAA